MVFLGKRILTGGLMLAIILLCGLWIIRLIPGSYSDLQEAEQSIDKEGMIRQELSLPLFYFTFKGSFLSNESIDFQWNGTKNTFHSTLGGYVCFDFGESVIDGVPVVQKFQRAWSWSLVIQLPALLILIFGSLWLSFESVLHSQHRWVRFMDQGLLVFHSIPGFWLATLFLLLFANPDFIALFPTGMQSKASSNPWTLLFSHPQYFLLPILTLALPSMAYVMQLLRNGLLESTEQWFWKRALSTGLSRRQALWFESLPLAIIPMLAWLAGVFPVLISGALVVEQIFSIPGLGRLLYQSIETRDWPTVQFLFFLAAAMTIAGFIISDLLLRMVDPRTKNRT